MTSIEKEKIANALDQLALALPSNFVWPPSLRKAYERAMKLLKAKS
jgi:hypothetical protein